MNEVHYFANLIEKSQGDLDSQLYAFEQLKKMGTAEAVTALFTIILQKKVAKNSVVGEKIREYIVSLLTEEPELFSEGHKGYLLS
ncbi:MAG: hypothetical protein AAF298_02220 [Cyanobacteria bacterium P01_A01_bin.40]